MQENIWAFMYVSTAGLTGVLVVGMFLLRPADLRVGQAVVFLIALVLITGTLQIRKGLALAFEYALQKRWGMEPPAEKREDREEGLSGEPPKEES